VVGWCGVSIWDGSVICLLYITSPGMPSSSLAARHHQACSSPSDLRLECPHWTSFDDDDDVLLLTARLDIRSCISVCLIGSIWSLSGVKAFLLMAALAYSSSLICTSCVLLSQQSPADALDWSRCCCWLGSWLVLELGCCMLACLAISDIKMR
jgi:hypothetical protein